MKHYNAKLFMQSLAVVLLAAGVSACVMKVLEILCKAYTYNQTGWWPDY